MTTKARLLAAYAHKPVTHLVQFDCFAEKGCDDIVQDLGGYGCTWRETHELMRMAPEARLLVRPNADFESVRKWLLAMAEHVEKEVRHVARINTANGSTHAVSELQDALEIARQTDGFAPADDDFPF